MLASTFALATLALSGSAFASIDYDHDSGRLAAVDSSSRHDLDSEIAYKELCYRNLYADVDAFQVKNQKELLLSDTQGKSVFLSDGLKKAYDDVEYYYEEFCYKQYKERSHSNDVENSNGILVGKRDFGSSLGLGGLSGFSAGSNAGGDGLGGASGLFSKGSFLDTFSKGDGMGDFGLGFGADEDQDKKDGGEQDKDDSSTTKKDDGDKAAKLDQQSPQYGNDDGKGAFDGASFGSSLLGGGSGSLGNFGSGDGKQSVGDGKAYGDDKDDSHKVDGKGDGKDDGVKKRGFVLFSRRIAVSKH